MHTVILIRVDLEPSGPRLRRLAVHVNAVGELFQYLSFHGTIVFGVPSSAAVGHQDPDPLAVPGRILLRSTVPDPHGCAVKGDLNPLNFSGVSDFSAISAIARTAAPMHFGRSCHQLGYLHKVTKSSSEATLRTRPLCVHVCQLAVL